MKGPLHEHRDEQQNGPAAGATNDDTESKGEIEGAPDRRPNPHSPHVLASTVLNRSLPAGCPYPKIRQIQLRCAPPPPPPPPPGGRGVAGCGGDARASPP